MVCGTRGRRNYVEQGHIAWTKKLYFEIPIFRECPLVRSPDEKNLFTFLSVAKYNNENFLL